MLSDDLLRIFAAGSDAFQYARENLHAELEDPSQAEKTQAALKPQSIA